MAIGTTNRPNRTSPPPATMKVPGSTTLRGAPMATPPPQSTGTGKTYTGSLGGGGTSSGMRSMGNPLMFGRPPSFGGGIGAGGMGPPPSPTGSESGPGYLEQRYLDRLAGKDPAFNYALNRGGDAIDSRMAAGGSFNSGARGQQLSDFAANLAAQSQGQLDALAGGASGEHTGRLNSMFNIMNQLAGGQAGLASAYDLGAAGNMDAANRAQQQMFLNKAGVDSQANQGRFNNLLSMYSAYQSGGSGGGGGSTPAKV